MNEYNEYGNTIEEEKPKHNIFSSENYGIGRLEFLGCNVLIYILLFLLMFILSFLGIILLHIDKISFLIIEECIIGIIAIYLFGLSYAHRLYHIGWTDEMNSKTIAFILMIVCVGGSFLPIIKVAAIPFWFIVTLVLLLVPGGNE